MTPEALELVIQVAAVAVLAALIVVALRVGLRGGDLVRPVGLRLRCPKLDRDVDCTIVSRVRVGQWNDVVSCSAFDPPEAVTCGRECARAMNRGDQLGARIRLAS
jgi:hypothetical protein